MAKDARVTSAISHWLPRFVSNGVLLADFEDVTGGLERWEDWCAAWSRRAAVHEAAAQSMARPAPRLERPAPRSGGLAKGFVLGVLAAAAIGAALWFSGALESAPASAPATLVTAPAKAPAPAGR